MFRWSRFPREWGEGTTLEVARTDAAAVDIDSCAETMNRLYADSPAEEEAGMQAALDEARRQAKRRAPRHGTAERTRYLHGVMRGGVVVLRKTNRRSPKGPTCS